MVDSANQLVLYCCRGLRGVARFLDAKRHPPPALMHVIVSESEVRSLLNLKSTTRSVRFSIIFQKNHAIVRTSFIQIALPQLYSFVGSARGNSSLRRT